uniref:(northern house mosquito) hypothetical protein n=1 Tax=Culex pipiens TaxID=7175 RepID=A0A8D8JAF1_CULPI
MNELVQVFGESVVYVLNPPGFQHFPVLADGFVVPLNSARIPRRPLGLDDLRHGVPIRGEALHQLVDGPLFRVKVVQVADLFLLGPGQKVELLRLEVLVPDDPALQALPVLLGFLLVLPMRLGHPTKVHLIDLLQLFEVGLQLVIVKQAHLTIHARIARPPDIVPCQQHLLLGICELEDGSQHFAL